jgi:transcriptional regulator with XRE-family HTH domain
MSRTTTDPSGRRLREAREAAGLSRIELAAMIGCSLSQLGNIEQGAVPKRSRVLDAAMAAIESRPPNDERPPDQASALQESRGQAGHGEV